MDNHLNLRATVLRDLRRWAEAMADTSARVKLWPDRPDMLLDLAGHAAECATAAGGTRADEWSATAVGWVAAALKHGAKKRTWRPMTGWPRFATGPTSGRHRPAARQHASVTRSERPNFCSTRRTWPGSRRLGVTQAPGVGQRSHQVIPDGRPGQKRSADTMNLIGDPGTSMLFSVARIEPKLRL